MIRILAILVAACAAAGPAMSQSASPAEAARAAEERLAAASLRLEEANGASDRVAALTETVRAYEDGLGALRDGIRQAAARERAVVATLQAREDELAQLLGALSAMSAAPRPLLLLHPSGPAGTARAAMLLADLTPAMQAEAATIAASLDEIRILRGLQDSALGTLSDGLAGAQAAREALTAAVSDRTDLPRKYAEDPVAVALLLASTETLAGFASGLAETGTDLGGAVVDAAGLKGSLGLPVDGIVLRRAGEPDAAGVARPGWIIATRPRALVTLPVAATLRYKGQLLDYGTVAIVEPSNGVLMIFAGLEQAFGEPGEILPGGSALGLMGGPAPDAQGILTENQAGAGASRSETLYIEVRESDAPVNPDTWFVAE